jgi:hypothetical protein
VDYYLDSSFRYKCLDRIRYIAGIPGLKRSRCLESNDAFFYSLRSPPAHSQSFSVMH